MGAMEGRGCGYYDNEEEQSDYFYMVIETSMYHGQMFYYSLT